MKIGNALKITLAAMAVCVLHGCTYQQQIMFEPSATFVHPNSNVEPLGDVTAKATGAWRLMLPAIEASDWDSVTQKALRQHPGANTVIDVAKIAKVKTINLVYMQLYWTKYELQGTAAKVELGEQYLR